MLTHRARRLASNPHVSSAKPRITMHLPAVVRGSVIAPAAARMSGYSSAHPETPSEFRVEKSRADATLTLSNGTSVHGCFFISGTSRTHAGPEGVKDVLNSEAGFFPFDSDGS